MTQFTPLMCRIKSQVIISQRLFKPCHLLAEIFQVCHSYFAIKGLTLSVAWHQNTFWMTCKVYCFLQRFIWALKSVRSKILFRKFWVSFKDSSRFLYGLILNDLWRKAIMISVLLSYVKPKSRNVPCDCLRKKSDTCQSLVRIKF